MDRRGLALITPLLAFALAGPASAQDFTKYHNYGEMSAWLQSLAGANKAFVKIESIGQTLEKRDLWILEFANPAGVPVGERPGLLIAANFEGGIIAPFDSSLIPVYDRYRLGGERSLRGFSYYQVLPRKRNGDYFLTPGGAREGGDRYLQFNVEYQIKVGGPVKFILFLDVANSWHEDQGWDLGWWRYGTGAEMRIFLPVFQAPLRFIYGINLDPFPDEKARDFQFSIGTTF